MIMICQLLTEEPEGGSAMIPLWRFKQLYKFLASLDCSRKQIYRNGSRVPSKSDPIAPEEKPDEGPESSASATSISSADAEKIVKRPDKVINWKRFFIPHKVF